MICYTINIINKKRSKYQIYALQNAGIENWLLVFDFRFHLLLSLSLPRKQKPKISHQFSGPKSVWCVFLLFWPQSMHHLPATKQSLLFILVSAAKIKIPIFFFILYYSWVSELRRKYYLFSFRLRRRWRKKKLSRIRVYNYQKCRNIYHFVW